MSFSVSAMKRRNSELNRPRLHSSTCLPLYNFHIQSALRRSISNGVKTVDYLTQRRQNGWLFDATASKRSTISSVSLEFSFSDSFLSSVSKIVLFFLYSVYFLFWGLYLFLSMNFALSFTRIPFNTHAHPSHLLDTFLTYVCICIASEKVALSRARIENLIQIEAIRCY